MAIWLNNACHCTLSCDDKEKVFVIDKHLETNDKHSGGRVAACTLTVNYIHNISDFVKIFWPFAVSEL